MGDERRQPGRGREQGIVVPRRWIPGSAADKQAKIHANDNAEKSLCLPQPGGDTLWSLVRIRTPIRALLLGSGGCSYNWAIGGRLHRVDFLAACLSTGLLLPLRLGYRRRGWKLGRFRQSLIGHYKVGAAFAAPYLNGTIAGLPRWITRKRECRQHSLAAARGTPHCLRRRWCVHRDVPRRGRPRLRDGISG